LYSIAHSGTLIDVLRPEPNHTLREIVPVIKARFTQLRRDGLRKTLTRLRGRVGRVRSARDYARWLQQNQLDAAQVEKMAESASNLSYKPVFSIITAVHNTKPKWLRASIESVRRQVYPHWQLCLADDGSTDAATRRVLRDCHNDPRISVTHLDTSHGISAASNAALSMATGEFVVMLDHDDELSIDALYQIASVLNDRPDTDFLYSDEDKLTLDGRRCDPHFKPDWSPEYMLSCMYTCHVMTVRRSVIDGLGGFRREFDGAQDYDLVLRLMEVTSRIQHIPKVLYHWRKTPGSAAAAATAKPWAHDAGQRALVSYLERNTIDGDVFPTVAPGLFRVRRSIQGQPLVSIVIPTIGRPVRRNRHDILATAVTSLVERTTYRAFEIIVVTDSPDLTRATTRALSHVRHTVVPYTSEGSFNFSHKLNIGVRHASGEHVVFFNDDLEVIAPEWLSAMLEFSQLEAIGAVGAKLFYPDGRLQHIGVLLGVNGVAAHAFHQHPGASLGYAGSAVSVRNVSAVTAACMMTRRRVFEEVGGFDEALAVDFNDVDYCLRLRERGYRIVFTPYAELSHRESASFGPRTQHPAEMALMSQRWQAAIKRDPFYNPSFSREFPDYRLRLDEA
jgi:GT2 family glycosyltransferase